MNNIKKFRGLIGISQTELAQQVGLARATISLLEKPDCHSITENNAVKIANVLQCSVIELYGLDNIKLKPKNDAERVQLIKIIFDSIEDEEIKNNILNELGVNKWEL